MIAIMATSIGRRRRAHLYVKEWMDHRGLSDEQVANRLGKARETIWRWRKEQHRLNPEKLGALAEALDMDARDFYRPPSQPSLDALVAGETAEVQQMAADIVRRLIARR